MTRAQTMDVVNGATDIENEINKELNRLRLPTLEWDWSDDIEWWPGDPLHPKPYKPSFGFERTPTYMTEDGLVAGGQFIRPMFEVFYDDEDFEVDDVFLRCQDCEVSGAWLDTECWFCGKAFAVRVAHPVTGAWLRPMRRVMTFNETADERIDSIVRYDPGDAVDSIARYDPGDAVEDFDTSRVRSLADFFSSRNLTPWQAAFLQTQSNRDTPRPGSLMYWPSRNAGRAYAYRMQAQMYAYMHALDMESPEPVPAVQHDDDLVRGRRPPQVQRVYPTSSNPTQERRRRNH